MSRLSSDPIYFVTIIKELPRDGILSDMGARCIGYFFQFAPAEELVLANAMDMSRNGRYPYAVIEKVREGLHKYANSKQLSDSGEEQERWFYRFNHATGKYEPMIEPDSMAYVVGIGIG